MKRSVPRSVSRYLAEIGRKGGKSKMMPAVERQASARRAALARWRGLRDQAALDKAQSRSPRRRKPIWEVARELLAGIPESELRGLPPDAASELDHYLYGAPRRKQ